jgi:hypothetical protein
MSCSETPRVCDRLSKTLDNLVPEWSEMIFRVVERERNASSDS